MLFQHATDYGKPRGPVLFMQTKVDWAMTMPAAAAPGHHLEICNLSLVLSAKLLSGKPHRGKHRSNMVHLRSRKFVKYTYGQWKNYTV